MDRREFTGKALLAMLAGVTVTITGCSGTEPTAPVVDKNGVIENNHGHVARITAAQQTAGGAVTLSIQGEGSHDHVLELAAAEVVRIRNGYHLEKQCAMTRNHVHTISFN